MELEALQANANAFGRERVSLAGRWAGETTYLYFYKRSACFAKSGKFSVAECTFHNAFCISFGIFLLPVYIETRKWILVICITSSFRLITVIKERSPYLFLRPFQQNTTIFDAGGDCTVLSVDALNQAEWTNVRLFHRLNERQREGELWAHLGCCFRWLMKTMHNASTEFPLLYLLHTEWRRCINRFAATFSHGDISPLLLFVGPYLAQRFLVKLTFICRVVLFVCFSVFCRYSSTIIVLCFAVSDHLMVVYHCEYRSQKSEYSNNTE